MRKKKFAAMLGLTLSLLVLLIPFHASKASTSSSLDDWSIRTMDVHIILKENGIFHVETTIDGYFNTPGHGIVVSVPLRYFDVQLDDGELLDYYWPINNVHVNDQPFSVKKNFYDLAIKIGNPYSTFEGKVSFSYSYDVHSTALDLYSPSRSLFYYNLVGSGWDAPVHQTTFTLEFPASFSETPVFYPPAYNSNQDVTYQQTGNTITGSYNGTIRPGQALTVSLELPEHYFAFSPPSSIPSLLVLGLMILGLGYLVWLFMRYGKDSPIVESVEFRAPKGLSSAQVGYIYKGSVHDDALTSLIFEWDAKGFLTIEETEQHTLLLTKQAEPESFDIPEETALFDTMFKNKNSVDSKQLGTGFGKGLASVRTAIPRFFKQGDHRLYTQTSIRYRILAGLGVSAMMGLFAGVAAYQYYLFFLDSFLVWTLTTLVSGCILALIIKSIDWFTNDLSRQFRLVWGISFIIVVAYCWGYLVCISSLLGASPLLTLIQLAFFLFASLLVANLRKPTAYRQILVGEVLGLKRFIAMAEKERLEALARQTPSLFKDILPYAYVLGVSDQWINQFEHIGRTNSSDPKDQSMHSSRPLFRRSSAIMRGSVKQSIHRSSGSRSSSYSRSSSGRSGGGFGGGGGHKW